MQQVYWNTLPSFQKENQQYSRPAKKTLPCWNIFYETQSVEGLELIHSIKTIKVRNLLLMEKSVHWRRNEHPFRRSIPSFRSETSHRIQREVKLLPFHLIWYSKDDGIWYGWLCSTGNFSLITFSWLQVIPKHF